MENGEIIGISHLPSVYSGLLGIFLFFVELNPFLQLIQCLFLGKTFLSRFSFLFQKLKKMVSKVKFPSKISPTQ